MGIGTLILRHLYWPSNLWSSRPKSVIIIIIIIIITVKTKVIPVIIGATGTISKSFRKYVSNIPVKHEVKELQKTAILGTAHILRKVLT
jgi:Sec-independent protein translocase protein TatA